MANYSVWVLEYSFVKEFPLSGLVYGAHNQGACKLPYAYVLIKGKDTTILVDCGHNNAAYGKVLSERYGVENWRAPSVVLGECGVSPEQVEHIIITHAHFDHMGGMALFPNAKFYIQERELTKWVWSLSLDKRFRWLMTAADPADIIRAVELARDGRLCCVRGDLDDLLPGIDVRLAEDSHTPGSQYVVLRNDGRRESEDVWVLTGDLVYRMENLHGGDLTNPFYVPVGLATGSQFNLIMATDRMSKVVGGDLKRIVPPHEERLPTSFPSRVSAEGLQIIEIALADGEVSRV
jgi:N-acyl homoserine lactone hydrolase